MCPETQVPLSPLTAPLNLVILSRLLNEVESTVPRVCDVHPTAAAACTPPWSACGPQKPMGVQFRPPVLRQTPHTSETYTTASMARQAGFEAINVDPGTSISASCRNIGRQTTDGQSCVSELPPPGTNYHVSYLPSMIKVLCRSSLHHVSEL